MKAAIKPMAFDYLKDPEEIYRQSFAIVRKEAEMAGFPPDVAHIAERLIHAVGMPDLADELAWDGDVGVAGSAALNAGRPILTDGRMTAEGVIRRMLKQHNPIICTLDHAGVADDAVRTGTTRSAAAVGRWTPYLEGAVVAIGNAPTALFHLLEMLQAGAPKPALVFAFPVGFVGASESKAAAIQSLSGMIPFVTLRGRRGGSPLAAAAVNALSTWKG